MEKTTTQLDPIQGKILVFGGSYSNLQALEALHEYATENGYKKENTFCTGDVVAYCAQPEESVQLIRNWGVHCIAGNVEIQLHTGADDCGCNFEGDSRCDLFSRQWYPFAKANLSESSIEWMKSLPDFIQFRYGNFKMGVVHGTFDETAGYIFDSTPWAEKEAQLNKVNIDVALAGHCGLPFSETVNGKAWLNAGVIGMPANDGTDRVWFMTMELIDREIIATHHAIEYDTHEPSARMREEKLPQEYAHTLLTGVWDSNEILPEIETANEGIPLPLDGTSITVKRN